MSYSILLRKMTEKSILGFGYEDVRDLSIGQLLAMNKHRNLVSAYYGLEKISFIDDILLKIGITEDLRIEKPGKVSRDVLQEHVKKAMNNVYANKTEKEIIHIKHVKKIKKNVAKRNSLKEIMVSNRKDILQRKNQGKK